MQEIQVFFYHFHMDHQGTAFGLGIPLTKCGVATNIGEGSRSTFVNGRSVGKWRIATELEGASAFVSKGQRLKTYLSGSVLVAVSQFGDIDFKNCFLSSDPIQTTKSFWLTIDAKELGLKYMAGIQKAYLSGCLCELHFPGCLANTLKEEFSDIEKHSLSVGDYLPLVLEPSGVVGVFAISEIVNQSLKGTFYFQGDVFPSVGDVALIRFFGDLIGTRLVVASQLGQVAEVVAS